MNRGPAEWVESAHGLQLNEFQSRAVALLCKGYRTGPWNLQVKWQKVEWRYGRGVAFTVRHTHLSTYDFDFLTRLVIGAHEESIRIEINPKAFQYIQIVMHPRSRDGLKHERHPTIEQAVADYRGQDAVAAPPAKAAA